MIIRAFELWSMPEVQVLAVLIGDRARLELAYSLMLALPGAPVLRYGEEIGMGENLRLRERNSIRTPMQWSAEENAGFSTAKELVRPVIDKGPYRYGEVNVEEHGLPQAGHIAISYNGKDYDLDVKSEPAANAEKVVICIQASGRAL